MPITILNDLYKEKGQEFIDNLFNLEVVIKEKLAGSAFCFEKLDDNTLRFYKRDSNNPITKIERTLMKFYEDAIQYLESLDGTILDQLPNEHRFCFEYFPVHKPAYILYDNLPKHKLILTHILKKVKANTYKTISDKETIDNYARLLDVDSVPILYQGYLTENQKHEIKEYLRLTNDEIKTKYENNSFVRFIIKLLNPQIDSTMLNNTLEKSIDGIIFTFSDKENQVHAKLIDPIFHEIVSKNRHEEEKNDYLPIIYANIIEFTELESIKFDSYRLTGKTFDERYIELICRLFNNFIKRYGERYVDIELNLPEFMTKPEFDLNVDLLDNPRTIDYINSNLNYKNLFKIYLNLFRKKKKNNNEFLTLVNARNQNSLVDTIVELIKEDYNPNTFPTFGVFLEMQDEDYTLVTEDLDISNIEFKSVTEHSVTGSDNDNMEDLSAMKLVAFWQHFLIKKDNPQTQPSKKKLNEVNLMIGRFQPFHNGHYEFAKELYEKNKKPVIIFQVGKEHKTNLRPFDRQLNEEMLNDIIQSNQKIFKKFYIYNTDDIDDILKYVSDEFKPVTISSSKSLITKFNKELKYSLKEAYTEELFEFKEFSYLTNVDKQNVRSEKIIDLIKNDKYFEFKKFVPECLHNKFEKFKEQLK